MPKENKKTKKEAEEKEFKEKKETGKKKVLIIEDDAMISGMYKMKLEDDGFTVSEAGEGALGLQMAKNEKPDLVLLDIMLPMTDGFSILTQMRQDPSLKNVPVIVLTNLSTSEDMEKGKTLGAADYIVKANITPSEVVAKVKKYI